MWKVGAIASAVSLLLQWPVAAISTPQWPLGPAPEPVADPRPHRVAIIGAGPGGSSASYYLHQFSQSSTDALPLQIDIFESTSRVGGRTTTVNALDDPRYPAELGASIFVKINHILFNATRDFDLTPTTHIYQTAPEAQYEIGIWDGSEFVFKAATDDDGDGGRGWRGWWDVAKLLWKYGLSPIRTQRAMRTAVAQFLAFYDPPLFPFPSLQSVVAATGLDAYTQVSGRNILKQVSVGDLFARDIVQASTRVNYASNLGGIHGLETLVCMAIEGAMAVDGGNWHIFDEMVQRSATHLFLNTTVTQVIKDEHQGTFSIRTQGDRLPDTQMVYDSVVLAAPYQFSNVSFSPPLANPPLPVSYNSLYVTLFTSPHRLSPSFFGLDSPADVPSSILTTLPPELDDKLASRHGLDGVGPPGFWSISTLRVLHPDTDGTMSPSVNTSLAPQFLYKIFSPAPLTATFLASILGIPHSLPSNSSLVGQTQTPDDSRLFPAGDHMQTPDDSLHSLPKQHVTWIHEKHWLSYPHAEPRKRFENFTLHTTSSKRAEVDVEGLWYLSVMEPFISTMETSALAGMNVARLIVDGL